MEVKAVEILLTVGEFPVDGATREIFFPVRASGIARGSAALRSFAIRFA
jgi:hypothetical protein